MYTRRKKSQLTVRSCSCIDPKSGWPDRPAVGCDLYVFVVAENGTRESGPGATPGCFGYIPVLGRGPERPCTPSVHTFLNTCYH